MKILRKMIALPIAGTLFLLAKLLPKDWRLRQWLIISAFRLLGVGAQ